MDEGQARFHLLKLRNLIADKEWFTARANFETSKFGAWQSNWADPIKDINSEIEAEMHLLEPREERA